MNPYVSLEEAKKIIRELLKHSMSGLRIVLQRFVRRWRDPFLIDQDWDDFKAMNDEQLRVEYDWLLTERPQSDRFRRLCHYISSRWVYALNSKLSGGSPSAGADCWIY